MSESDHSLHSSNVLLIIKKIKSGEINSETAICLERKQYGNNLGMRDVIKLANMLKSQNSDLGEWVKSLPLYSDSLLYNVARANDISVIGIEGKGLEYSKESVYYNQARELHMVERLTSLALHTDKKIIFLVGAAHMNNLHNLFIMHQDARSIFSYITIEDVPEFTQSTSLLLEIDFIKDGTSSDNKYSNNKPNSLSTDIIFYSKLTDVITGSVSLYHQPNKENANSFAYSVNLFGIMVYGASSITFTSSSLLMLNDFLNQEYSKAFSGLAINGIYLSLKVAEIYFGIDIASTFTSALSAHAIYHSFNMAINIYQDINSESGYIASLIAYKNLYTSLEHSLVSDLYDFASLKNHYESTLNKALITQEYNSIKNKLKLEQGDYLGTKLADYIYKPLIEVKYLINKQLVSGVIREEDAANILKAQQVTIKTADISYDICAVLDRIYKNDEAEMFDSEVSHYNCYSIELQRVDYIEIDMLGNLITKDEL
jgi:hypothetical protein